MKNKNKIIKSAEDALNKKYKQKIELLFHNDMFLDAIKIAQLQLRSIIEKYDKSFAKLLETTSEGIRKKDGTKEFRISFEALNAEVMRQRTDKKIVEISIAMAKKFKLYPADQWGNLITSIILEEFKFYDKDLYDVMVSFNPWFKSASKYGFGVLQNCDVGLKTNSFTKEREVLIRIYPDTSLGDIKKSWAYIKKLQSVIKKELKTKQWYPKKNIQLEKKLCELDRQNISDYEKQEKLFGELNEGDWGPIENKRKNNLRQIRHRIKKN